MKHTGKVSKIPVIGFAIIAAIALSAVLLLTGCEEPESAHVHDEGTWVTTLPPTCTETGKKELRCTVDQFVLDTGTIAALGHDYGNWTATLDSDISKKICSRDQTHQLTGLTGTTRFTFEPIGETATAYSVKSGTSTTDAIAIPDYYRPDAQSDYLLIMEISEWAFNGSLDITSITIPAGLTKIGNSAFNNCTSLTSITIPDSVTSIGSSAFYNCTSLTSITIPAGVTKIGDYTFNNCTSLTDITIHAGVTEIGQFAFYYCTSLTSIDIPEGVETISNYTFYYCTSLAAITIPAGITSIGNHAFQNCAVLISITIPEGVETIGENAFEDCTGLTSINILEGVETIGTFAFWNCTSLTSITIPASVTSMGVRAFSGWTTSQTINVPFANDNAKPEEWDTYWKLGCNAVIKYWNGSAYE